MKGISAIIQNVRKEKLKGIKKSLLISLSAFSAGTILGSLLLDNKPIFEKILQIMLHINMWVVFITCLYIIILTIIYFQEKRKWNNGRCVLCNSCWTKIYPWPNHTCLCRTFNHIFKWDKKAWDKDE